MTVTHTFDVFCTVDGFGSYGSSGDWGGYWGRQGPEFLDRRLTQYNQEQRLVLGADTFREFVHHLGPDPDAPLAIDPINTRMRTMPTTVSPTRCTAPSTGRTRPWRAATPSASSPGSRRSPRRRRARTAGWR